MLLPDVNGRTWDRRQGMALLPGIGGRTEAAVVASGDGFVARSYDWGGMLFAVGEGATASEALAATGVYHACWACGRLFHQPVDAEACGDADLDREHQRLAGVLD